MTTRWQIAQYFEARWWQRYLQNQPVPAYLAWKKEYWRAFLRQHQIILEPSDKILDAGCGPAGLFMMLPGYEVLAIDPLLDFYQKKIPHFNRQDFPSTRFAALKTEQLEEKERFTKIFCLNAINHVGDLEKSIKHLTRALVKNGILYLSIDAHNYLFLKHLFRLVPGDILHPHQLSLPDYISLLEKYGLNILQTSLVKKGTIFNYYLIKAVKG